MNTKTLIFTLVCALSGFGVQAQTFKQTLDTKKLDSLFDVLNQKTTASGSVAIYKNGTVYSRAFGYRYVSFEQDRKIPNDTETGINIGSISKPFTATMIFRLIDQGKLSLDHRLSEWYPDVPNADKITIRHLLAHRSGLNNYLDNPTFQMTMASGRSRAEMMRIFTAVAPDFGPDERWAYSNTGYMLLSYIIEEVTGWTYEKALKKMIAEPLNMQRTELQPQRIDARKRNVARSFWIVNGRWDTFPNTHVDNSSGAGGIVSTPEDLITFVKALFDGKIISPESLDSMKNPTSEGMGTNFGLGLAEMRHNRHKGLGHTGGIDGYRSALAYFPQEDVIVVGCFNALSPDMGRDVVMPWVQAIAFDEPFTIPSFEQGKAAIAVLDSYTGLYASEQLPIRIAITRKGDKLQAQGQGQGAFELTTLNETEFKNDTYRLRIKFLTNDQMQLMQGGTFLFTKQEKEQ